MDDGTGPIVYVETAPPGCTRPVCGGEVGPEVANGEGWLGYWITVAAGVPNTEGVAITAAEALVGAVVRSPTLNPPIASLAESNPCAVTCQYPLVGKETATTILPL